MNLNNLRANAYLSQNKKPENDGKNNIPNEDSGVINQIGTQGFSKTEIDSNVDFKNPDLGILKVPEGTGETESVYRRVAKFLLLIGEEESAKILPHLSEKQIEKIVPEIASIRTVSNDEAAVILAEFKGLLNQSRKSGGIETAKDMLEKAYGKDKAERMLHKAIPFEGKVPFEYFRDADNEKIYRLLSDESVGVQSIVLSHLEPKKSAAVINLMNAAEKKDVVLRLAKMQPIEPDVVRRIDHSMHEKALAYTAEKAENIDGRNALAQILKKMDAGKENEILHVLRQKDSRKCQILSGVRFSAAAADTDPADERGRRRSAAAMLRTAAEMLPTDTNIFSAGRTLPQG